MTQRDLGFHTGLEEYQKEHQLEGFMVGRVVLEHKERYVVVTENGEYDSELLGNLRFTAESRRDFPAVGDWVALSEFDDGKALIHALFPRTSILERQEVGKRGQKQLIATNIDVAMVVLAVDLDFNLNRLERYLILCNESGIDPLIVLSKIDLVSEEELTTLTHQLKTRLPEVAVFAISNETGRGVKALENILEKGKTYCLLGSSGAGKSTLLNTLSGKTEMKTGDISDAVKKGKHTTTHRQLFPLENGSLLIDNPGMREVGIGDASGGLETTFEMILELAKACKFKDCTHQQERGCAVQEALNNGELDRDAFINYQKMLREKQHFESTVAEKRQKEKSLGKLYRHYQQIRKKNEY